MADTWVSSMATHYQTLIGYLTQYGMLVPLLTTAQRDSVKESTKRTNDI